MRIWKHIKCIIVNTLKSAVILFTPDNFLIVSSKDSKVNEFRTKRKIFTHRKILQVNQNHTEREGRREGDEEATVSWHIGTNRSRRWEDTQYCIRCLSLSILCEVKQIHEFVRRWNFYSRIQFEAVKRPYLRNVIVIWFCCRIFFSSVACILSFSTLKWWNQIKKWIHSH